MPESTVLYGEPTDYTSVVQSKPPLKPRVFELFEQVSTRYPGRIPFIESTLVQEYGKRPYETLTPEQQYRYVASEQSTQLTQIRQSITYIESLPPGETVTLESGETITREEAINRLRMQEQNIISGQQQIMEYQREGYVVERDPQGNLVFRKKPEEVYVDDSEDRLKQAQREYQDASIIEQAARAVFAGATMFPVLLYNLAESVLRHGSILASPKPVLTSVYESGKEMLLAESKGWKQLRTGDMSGWAMEHVIKSPAVMDIVIPFSVGAAVGPLMGTISKIGIQSVAAGSKIVGPAIQYYPYVAGGIWSGLAAAGVTGTLALEQRGLVEPGSTFRVGMRTGVQFASAYVGYTVTAKMVSPSFKKEIITVQDRTIGMEYAYGRKYVDVFGKQIYYGKMVYGGKKPITTLKVPVPIIKEAPSPPPIVSVSQIRGIHKVTFDVTAGKYVVEKIPVSKKMKPLVDTKFIKPVSTIKPIGDVSSQYKPPSFDLFKKVELKPVQKTLESFTLKGRYLVEPSGVKQLETIPSYKKITKIQYEKIQKAIKKPYVYVDKKPVLIQTKLLEEPTPSFKPLYDVKFKPPVKKIVTLEEIYTKKSELAVKQFVHKPIVKPRQTALDKLFRPSSKVIVAYTKPLPPSKPFPKIKTTTEKPVVPLEKTKLILEEPMETKEIKPEPEPLSPYREAKKPVVTEEMPISEYWVDISPAFKIRTMPVVITVSERRPSKEEPFMQQVLSQKDTMQSIGSYQDILRKQGLDITTRSIQSSQEVQDVIVLSSQAHQLAQSQIQQSRYAQELMQKYGFDFRQVPKKVPAKQPTKISIIDLSREITEPVGTGIDSYHVQVRPRQYKDGKRISKGTPYRATKKPLRYDDARSMGAFIVGKNAKATFILEPSKDKPGKLPKHITPWHKVMLQYDKKDDDRFVERSKFRIDSLGEIREISMRGWKARRKKRRR